MEYVKPPLGCRPRSIAESQRITEIADCIERHTGRRYPIRTEWVEEYNELIKRNPEEWMWSDENGGWSNDD